MNKMLLFIFKSFSNYITFQKDIFKKCDIEIRIFLKIACTLQNKWRLWQSLIINMRSKSISII